MVNYPLDFLIKKIKNAKIVNHTIAINSRKCNRSCGYCAVKNLDWPLIPFDVFEIENAFEESFKKGDDPHLLFVGGEPFYDPEAVEVFFHICNKFKDKLSHVEILSNMDFFPQYRERLIALDMKSFNILATSREGKVYKSEKNIHIYNKTFFDEIKFDFEYPVGPEYTYLFNLKVPSFWNDTKGEYLDCLDMDKIDKKIAWFHENKCHVYLDTAMNFSAKKRVIRDFYEEYGSLKQMVNFPTGWKSQVESRDNVCAECSLDCHLAIPGDKCKVLPAECATCSLLPNCGMLNELKLGFDKRKLSSCDRMREVLLLADKYRKLQSDDPDKPSEWNH